MSLTDKDLKTITAAVEATIKSLAKDEDNSVCITDKKHLDNFLARLRALGNGDLGTGIDIFSRNISLIERRRRLSERVGGNLIIFVVVSIAGGIIALLLWGFIAWIKASLSAVIPLT